MGAAVSLKIALSVLLSMLRKLQCKYLINLIFFRENCFQNMNIALANMSSASQHSYFSLQACFQNCFIQNIFFH